MQGGAPVRRRRAPAAWRQPAVSAGTLQEGDDATGADGISQWRVVVQRSNGNHRWYRTAPSVGRTAPRTHPGTGVAVPGAGAIPAAAGATYAASNVNSGAFWPSSAATAGQAAHGAPQTSFIGGGFNDNTVTGRARRARAPRRGAATSRSEYQFQDQTQNQTAAAQHQTAANVWASIGSPAAAQAPNNQTRSFGFGAQTPNNQTRSFGFGAQAPPPSGFGAQAPPPAGFEDVPGYQRRDAAKAAGADSGAMRSAARGGRMRGRGTSRGRGRPSYSVAAGGDNEVEPMMVDPPREPTPPPGNHSASAVGGGASHSSGFSWSGYHAAANK